MKLKNLLAILLVVCMLTALFAACNKTDDGDDFEEIVEINFWFIDYGTTPESADVEAAMNEITEREIGVRVKITSLPIADYRAQLPLAISNNDQIDLAQYHPAIQLSQLVMTSAAMDITDLLDEHGSELKELLGAELLSTTSSKGRVMGIPNYRVSNSNVYLIYRKDVLEDAGVLSKAENMTTWAEFEEVLEAVKEKGDTYAFGGQNNAFINSSCIYAGPNLTDTYVWDNLGDGTSTIWSDQDGNVGSRYDQQGLVDTYKMIADWADRGYIWPDSAVSQESIDTVISQKTYAGAFNSAEFGIESTKKQSIGTDVLCYMLTAGYVQTSSGNMWGSFIPVSAKEPVAAMKFLNLLFNSSELMNLFIWGLEDVHYTVNENGEATYLEGKDISTAGYHRQDFMMGNAFALLPWAGQGGGFRERALENFLAAPRSVYCGLSVDLSADGALVSAIAAVRDEYLGQLETGMYTDSLYGEFKEKLDAAGVADYVQLFQSAVDEFVA